MDAGTRSNFEERILAASRILSQAGLLLLIAYAVATLTDGLARGLFGRPIDAVRDLGGLVVAVAVSSCFPQAFLEKQNIVISFVENLLGRTANRALDIGAAALTFVVLLLFAWEFHVFAGNLAKAGEVTGMLEIPKAPFWHVVDLNLWCAAVAQGVVLRHELRRRRA